MCEHPKQVKISAHALGGWLFIASIHGSDVLLAAPCQHTIKMHIWCMRIECLDLQCLWTRFQCLATQQHPLTKWDRSYTLWCYAQTWGQFHTDKFFNSNSIFYRLFTYYFLPWVGTLTTYLEYLLRVIYIPNRIVMEEIFLIKKILNWSWSLKLNPQINPISGYAEM